MVLLKRSVVVLAMALAPCVFAHGADAQEFRDSFTAVTKSNFDSGGAISRQFHLNAESYLTMATIGRRTPPRELVVAPNQALANLIVSLPDGKMKFADYVAQDPLLDGVVILHNGQIVFEAYPNMNSWGRHFAWSVTKVFTSSALAVLAERRLVNMEAPVERYVPALADSAWAGIAVQDIANMASGIDCLDSDGYQDQTTCIYKLEESLGITAPTGSNPEFMEQLQTMRRRGQAGAKYEYVSANTNVLMLVIEAVTGQPYAMALQNLIWDPIGAEADALMAISPSGHAYASGGLHARLRDVARFGQIYVQPDLSGALSESSVRSIQNAGVPLTPESIHKIENDFRDDLPVRASWQWDLVWPDGALYKSGYSGQGLYVDPARGLVIAWFGTGLNFNETRNDMLPLTRQLARSTAFDRPARGAR